MMAAVSLNLTSCARAFSSDMWFTPKNWLSPKRMRSMVATWEASAVGPVRLENEVHDAVRLIGASEGILVRHVAGANGLGEGLELRRIFLASQVEPHGLLEAGDVARVPALDVVLESGL